MERKAKDNDPFVFAEKYGDKIAFVGTNTRYESYRYAVELYREHMMY
jgi:hypothetical protein